MKKKIIVGTSLGLVLALMLTVVILATVPRSYKPEIDSVPRSVKVVEISTGDEFETGVAFASSAKYEKIIELFDKSYEQSILSGMFSGKSKDVEIELVSSLPKFNKGYTITFEYKYDMVLKFNGETYYDDSNSQKEVKYQTIIFNVESSNGFNDFNIYAKEVVKNKSYYYQISSAADTRQLYSYLTELSYN